VTLQSEYQTFHPIATESLIADAVEALARGKYAAFNVTHLHEKLTQVEGFILSRTTVQRILREAGLSSPQKRRPPNAVMIATALMAGFVPAARASRIDPMTALRQEWTAGVRILS
jgi:hypothetical protein